MMSGAGYATNLGPDQPYNSLLCHVLCHTLGVAAALRAQYARRTTSGAVVCCCNVL